MQTSALLVQEQQGWHKSWRTPDAALASGGASLGDIGLQVPRGPLLLSDRPRMQNVVPKIEFLKKRHFTDQGREARIAKSLAALEQPNPIQLTREQWIWIAETLDSEDDFE